MKSCRNQNSLTQHEIRCPSNPDRYDYDKLSSYIRENRKGKTKDNCIDIQRQVETLNKKIQSGWVYPNKGRPRKIINYRYQEHNDEEIQKWISYVSSLNITVPEHKTYLDGKYRVVSNQLITTEFNQKNGTHTILHEHVYFMILVFGDSFDKGNLVHHVDADPSNNDFTNLIVFETNADHARFHGSSDAWLIYNENTHKFTCILNR